MASNHEKASETLNLTQAESESIGVVFPEAPIPVPPEMQEHPLHEQVGWALTEDDVAEALTGEVTPESREVVEDLFADLLEEEADRQGD